MGWFGKVAKSGLWFLRKHSSQPRPVVSFLSSTAAPTGGRQRPAAGEAGLADRLLRPGTVASKIDEPVADRFGQLMPEPKAMSL